MNPNKIKLDKAKRLNIRINYYIIQQTWHAKLGMRPRGFDIYEILGIKRQRYYKIIADNVINLTVVECERIRDCTELPLGCFTGECFIETDVKFKEWEAFFKSYDKYRKSSPTSEDADKIQDDFYTRKNKIDKSIVNNAENPQEEYKEFNKLCNWFYSNTAYKTVDATRFIKDLAEKMEERMTLKFIQQCDRDVLDEALITYTSKYELMKAVQTCNNQEHLEEEQKLAEKKKKE